MDKFLIHKKHIAINNFDIKAKSKVSIEAKKCIVSSSSSSTNNGKCIESCKKPLCESNLNESTIESINVNNKNVLENKTAIVCKQKVQKSLSGTALKTEEIDSRVGSLENRMPATNSNKNLSRKNENVNRSAISNFQQSLTTKTSIMSNALNSNGNSTILSMKELMKDIVVYVEVRSNEDNRSEGVKSVIAELGARINHKLLRDTTHVVFKDGLLSTYRKAKNWNIPIVSILWIEACKTQHKICNPLDFAISNVDRYENPEYYEKMKRIKAMQPDSELNKRVRQKAGTPKCNTPRTQKVASSQETSTPTTRNQPKTDIQKIKSSKDKVSILKGAHDSHKIVQYFTPDGKKNTQNIVDSPATVFLNKIERMSAKISESKKVENEKQTSEIVKTTENQKDTACNVTVRKTNEMDISIKTTPRKTNVRRLTMHHKPQKLLEKTTIAVVEEEEPSTPVANNAANLSLSLKQVDNETVLQTLPMEESINNLCATLSTTRLPAGGIIPFDSARKPGHRRTMFDVSMDIISERLQNINRSSRRSIMLIDTFKHIESPTDFPKVDLHEKKQELVNNDPTTPLNTLVKKKRKLFVPNLSDSSLLLGTPPPHTSTKISAELEESNSTIENPLIKLTPRIEKKRRRTIMHSNSKVVEQKKEKEVGTKLAQRRRTLMPLTKSTFEDDNEKVVLENTTVATKPTTRRRRTVIFSSQPDEEKKKQIENNNNIEEKLEEHATISCSAPPILPNVIDNIKRTVVSRRSTLDFVDDKQKELVTNKPKKIVKRVTNTPKVMVYTNMHRSQAEVIRQAVKTMGKFVLENVVNEQTTHLISLEPRRTMNLLRGLIRGLWILDYLWITDSLAAGVWLEEEPYELKGFSNAIKICRAERQAFGKSYRCELFTEMGPFYISTSCGPMSKDLVQELVKLGGGNVVDSMQNAKYIVTTYRRAVDDKIYITLKWVLDSLTQMQCLPHYKYAPSINHNIQT